jgi:hypothetical protein
MKIEDIKTLTERDPFRPFSVRLSNGAQYDFNERRDLGAPRKVSHTLVYCGESHLVLIDIESIVEVFINGEE